jgi:hypothetical protein
MTNAQTPDLFDQLTTEPTDEERASGRKARIERLADEQLERDDVAVEVARRRAERSGVAAKEFRVLRPADLAKPVEPIEWLIKGFWPLGSHGPIGGQKKSLKTYMATAAALALAAGRPALGNPSWEVSEPRAVLYFGGEGGEAMHRRRMQRMARDLYDADIADLPVYLLPDVAPFDTEAFALYLVKGIEAARGDGYEPALVVVDSVYNYHPAGIEVQNVYERGPKFTELSGLVRRQLGEDSVLWLVDHFRKTNSDELDLDSLAQAGMGEFADTWLLLGHRSGNGTPAPDPDAGRFYLRAEFGSRQSWTGAGWEVDWDIGSFDDDSCTYDKPITVDARRTGRAVAEKAKGRGATPDDIKALILDFVTVHPGMTQNKIIERVAAENRIGDKRIRPAFEELAEVGRLRSESGTSVEGGSKRTRVVWSLGDGRMRLRSKLRSPEEGGG